MTSASERSEQAPASEHADEPPDQDVIDLRDLLVDLTRAGDEHVLSHIEAGVPADLADPRGNTLLMVAVYHGHARLVTGLAARGADVDRLDCRGQSPLAGAVFKGAVDVVRALVEAGADADLGHPTARQSAELFDREDLAALLAPTAAPG